MKNLLYIFLSVCLILTSESNANQFDDCQSNLIKKLKRFDKSNIQIPKKQHKGNLKQYAEKVEMLCPWQIERDVNGDEIKDWIGIIGKDKKYQLIAYLSGNKKFDLQVLREYQFFPEQTYIELVGKKTIERETGRKYNSKSNYGIAEIFINHGSRFYLIQKGKMTVVHQFQDKRVIKKPITIDDDGDID